MIYHLKENRVYRTYLGGKNIDKFYKKENCENSFFPEDWTASVVRAFNPGRETINEGEGETREGIKIKNLVNDEMTCLVKLLDSAERLVIQVHPTVEFAKKHFCSKFGKTECWYFLNCSKNAYVYLGFKKGITKDKWVNAVYSQDSDLMLSMMNKLPVNNGDCVFVDGGVAHAIGEGCFMIEVQEPSDLMGIVEKKTPSGICIADTKLHSGIGFDNMLNMFDYTGYSIEEVKEKYVYFPRKISDGVYEIIGTDVTDKFSIHMIENGGSIIPTRKNGTVIVIDGDGYINDLYAAKGDRLFFNNDDEIKIDGNMRIIICC